MLVCARVQQQQDKQPPMELVIAGGRQVPNLVPGLLQSLKSIAICSGGRGCAAGNFFSPVLCAPLVWRASVESSEIKAKCMISRAEYVLWLPTKEKVRERRLVSM